MAKSKRNIMIAAIAVAVMLMCALAMAMVSCSGNAVAADERTAAEEAFFEDAVEAAMSGESSDADQADDAAEGEETTGLAPVSDSATVPLVTGTSGATANAPTASSGAPEAAAAPKTPSAPTQSAQPQSNTHAHNWIAEKTLQTVIDQPAWTETQYRTVEREICSVCGEDLTNGDSQGRSINEHGKAHVLAGEGGGWHSEFRQEAVGTIEHPAKTHTEYTVTGYRCSGCGATKGA